MRIGDYQFLALDYGDAIRSAERAKKRLGCGEDTERNQCVRLYIAADAE